MTWVGGFLAAFATDFGPYSPFLYPVAGEPSAMATPYVACRTIDECTDANAQSTSHFG